MTPIFLHSGFRTGSTWFWSRFRNDPKLCAYYEPFNDALATLTPDLAAGVTHQRHDRWASNHPPLDRPYFEEYRRLLREGGGVAGYDPAFSHVAYYRQESAPAQQRYLDRLAQAAARQGRRPVFAFCRSQGRLPWLTRRCPGLHIASFRNPLDQWLSFYRQSVEHRNAYFEFQIFRIAAVGSGDPVYRRYFADLLLPPWRQAGNPCGDDFLTPFFYAAHVDYRFRLFLRVVLLDSLIAQAHADLLVDLDRMSGDPAYRRRCTDGLRRVTGLTALQFDDCALPLAPRRAAGAWRAGLADALVWLDTIFAEPPQQQDWRRPRERLRRWLRQTLAAIGAAQTDAPIPMDRFLRQHCLAALRDIAATGDGGESARRTLDQSLTGASPLWRAKLAAALESPEAQQEIDAAGLAASVPILRRSLACLTEQQHAR